MGAEEAELNQLVSDFLMASGGRGADILFSDNPVQAVQQAVDNAEQAALESSLHQQSQNNNNNRNNNNNQGGNPAD